MLCIRCRLSTDIPNAGMPQRYSLGCSAVTTATPEAPFPLRYGVWNTRRITLDLDFAIFRALIPNRPELPVITFHVFPKEIIFRICRHSCIMWIHVLVTVQTLAELHIYFFCEVYFYVSFVRVSFRTVVKSISTSNYTRSH